MITRRNIVEHGVVRKYDSFGSEMRDFLVWYNSHAQRVAALPCATECASQSSCYATGFDQASRDSRKLTATCEIVYYTIGLHTQQSYLRNVENFMDSECYVAFVKKESPIGSRRENVMYGWHVIRVESYAFGKFSVGRRASRIPKITPRLFFADSVRYALYFDSALTPALRPQEVTSYMKVNTNKVVMAMHAHRFMMAGHVRTPMVSLSSHT